MLNGLKITKYNTISKSSHDQLLKIEFLLE